MNRSLASLFVSLLAGVLFAACGAPESPEARREREIEAARQAVAGKPCYTSNECNGVNEMLCVTSQSRGAPPYTPRPDECKDGQIICGELCRDPCEKAGCER